MNMADNSSPSKKKKYEKPSITDPETGRTGPRIDYGPVGATGCAYGAIGSSCHNGTSPSAPANACNGGGQPLKLNCTAGTSANDTCNNGTDAVAACSTGTRVAGDCLNGNTPQGATCDTGTGVL